MVKSQLFGKILNKKFGSDIIVMSYDIIILNIENKS